MIMLAAPVAIPHAFWCFNICDGMQRLELPTMIFPRLSFIKKGQK